MNLRDFLASKRALSKFKRNYLTTHPGSSEDLKSILQSEYENAICGAFPWRITPEGEEYWHTLDREWYNIYAL